jgi:hypothetical protein
MKKLLLTTTALLALSGAANATVVMNPSGASTGDLVVFDNSDGFTATAHLNGQHNNIVKFIDLAGGAFSAGATSGNDVKISSATDLKVLVFGADGTTLFGTSEQVFSIKGSGQITLVVTSVDANGNVEVNSPFTFPDNQLGNGQNFFTLTTLDGEVMTSLRITDVNGTIDDFEHYRLSPTVIPQVAAVPEISTWMMMIAGFFGVGGVSMLKRRREGGAAFRVA